MVDKGYLTFKNEQGDIRFSQESRYFGPIDECGEVILPPGYYEIRGHYFKGACTYGDSGCTGEVIIIDISVGEVIEKKFEVFVKK